MENTGYAAIAVSLILLVAGGFIAYTYYGIRYQSPVVGGGDMGTMNVFFTTTQAVNATSLTVFFSEIDAVQANGISVKLFTTSTSIDLTKVKGVQQSVGSFQIPPGTYVALVVGISQASEVVSGKTIALQVPAAASSGLRVPFPSPFTIPAGSTGGITLTFTVDTTALAAGNLSPTVSAALVLGIGVTTGATTSSAIISTTTTTTSTSKSCALGIPFWPFC